MADRKPKKAASDSSTEKFSGLFTMAKREKKPKWRPPKQREREVNVDHGATQLIFSDTGAITAITDDGVRLEIPKIPARENSDTNTSVYALDMSNVKATNDLIDKRYLHRDPLRKHRQGKSQWKLWKRRLYAVTWVNMLMRFRQPNATIAEIFIAPIILLIFLVSLTRNFNFQFTDRHKVQLTRAAADLNGTTQRLMGVAFCENKLICRKGVSSKAHIVYAPSNHITDRIMDGVLQQLHLDGILIPKQTEEEVIQECKRHYIEREVTGNYEEPNAFGIIFTLVGLDPPMLLKMPIPHVFSYKIRTFEKSISNTKELYPYFSVNEHHDISPYIKTGFIGVQNAIDQSFMLLIDDHLDQISFNFISSLRVRTDAFINNDYVKTRLKVFPYTLYVESQVRRYTWFLIVFTIYLGYFLTTYIMARRTIIERQGGILEILKLHGMPGYMDRLVILFNDGLLRGLTSILLTFILMSTIVKDAGFYDYDHSLLVWFFFVLHGMANIAFTFCLALFFAKPIFGACVIYLVGFISFFLPMGFYNSGFLKSKTTNMFLCILFPNWCLANGLFNFLKFEGLENQQTWWSPSTWADADQYILFPVLFCCLLFIISTIMYSFLAVYLDSVTENPLSAREGCCFCFKNDTNYVEKQEDDDEFEHPLVFEPELEPVLIKCRNLSFSYSHKKGQIALDNVNIDIHENQVTILLGKSGSGKTTLLQTIAGLVKPIRGYVRLKNMSMSDDPENLRHYVGYSPQVHILYDMLTVQESIRLCCMLHGREHLVARMHAAALMLRFGLYLSKDVGVKHLTECQKRKLSISMSLASNPAVLVLDEPTRGMNPMEKREIWRCIRVLKKGRCIVVTANTMEEADHYGDRIILMARGRILCVGSIGFLKQKYSSDSYVKLRAFEGYEIDVEHACNVLKRATGLTIQPVNPNLLGQTRDLCFPLPKQIPNSLVLSALEKHSSELGIYRITVSHVTLAGVLENIAHIPQFENEHLGNIASPTAEETRVDVDTVTTPEIPVLKPGQVKRSYWCLTMSALYSKQVTATVQNTSVLYQYIVPLLLLAMVVFSTPFYLAIEQKDAALKLAVDTYAQPLFPIWLFVHEADEYPVWNEAATDVSGKTQGRNVVFDNTNLGGKEFDLMLWPAIGSRTKYKAQVSIGMSRTHEFYTGHYASNALHSAPSALNYLSNLMLYLMTPDLDISAFPGHLDKLRKEFPIKIVTYNHPIEIDEKPTGTVRDTINGIVGIQFAFIVAMLAATKLNFCLEERLDGLKELQFTTGVTPAQYWTVTFTCDLVASNVLTVLVMAVLCIFGYGATFHSVEIKLTFFFLTMIFLSWSSLSYGYFMTLFMPHRFRAYGQYMAVHILTGIIPEIFNSLILVRLTSNNNVLSWFLYGFLIFPAYSLNSGFVLLVRSISQMGYCKRWPPKSEEVCKILDYLSMAEREEIAASDPFIRICCDKFCIPHKSCLKTEAILRTEYTNGNLNVYACLISMVAQGICFWLLLLILDYQIFQRFYAAATMYFTGDIEKMEARNTTGKKIDDEFGKDIDADSLLDKREDGEGKDPDDIILDVHGVTKYFKEKRALNHIYFTAKKGDILGIMGEDNSGKTVLMEIITGDLKSSLGTVHICGISSDDNRAAYLSKLAFCPETNPIHDCLTAFQMMQFIGRLRGMPAESLDIHARQWLQLMGFDEKLMNSKILDYPPGVQRQLCGAMTLIGNCEILIFDGPTDNLDAMEHTSFWSIIERVRTSGQFVIFTSKSAEECLQITTKLLVLANGEIQALGSPDEIYDKYPKKWSIMVRFKPVLHGTPAQNITLEGIEDVREYISSIFINSELIEELDNLLMYHVHDPEDKYPLSYMYKVMEQAKNDLPDLIEDFFIEETSLDDLFGHISDEFRLHLSHSSLDTSQEDVSEQVNAIRPKNSKAGLEDEEEKEDYFHGHDV